MSHERTHGGYRTGGLWAAAGIAFGALAVCLFLALFGMLEFDERCMHGLVSGPGRLQEVRYQAFPPATVCEFQGGDVMSVGGREVLGPLLRVSLLVVVVCGALALLAECFDPRPGGRLVTPMSTTEKVRRTGTAFTVTGSTFLLLYALAGSRLLAGPSEACSAGGDWGDQAPRTLDHSFFPPQATCQFTSGLTEPLNHSWLASLTAQSAAPALLAGVGFALALRRRRAESRAVRHGTGPAVSPEPDRENTR
ncbi:MULTISPECIES: hypothetical protein [Streptomyces]|uniref:Uncharacterized protein n=1 Tax=Streptomyces glycanivorans TaxID=3033808 RepID=A0ABY9JBN7_9ACTN|nr:MULTISPECIES: hypothetical protein [unclassified Streptomyces]WSQ77936.1 hypothetical protein OG725_12840 [Streptomyces sp. NBC_01213]WLQ64555.1 hypothetical protein P8A20_13560 [Streptomyces sp. Alt3]WSQ85309.1 hypothetical protein OG722_13510 [Streptomyces sp. NBC_01212]WSR08599.1 hypothetical protein OG265_22505 [Streptomyces sp. NBC_01208]WSR48652.1 hypothetical protein OG279_13890 [Streptomyces sp. NBC_01201]